MKAKVSVIIPVFNVQDCLEQCLQSVLGQSFQDFELLLIDDGSTDESGALCDLYARRDHRIRVVHQKNGGVSSARNKGIKISQGEYLTFIDSDDWVDADYLSTMVEAMERTVCELVLSGLVQERGAERIFYVPDRTKTFLLDAAGVPDFIDLNQKYLLYGPCTKLYKRSLVEENNVFFDPRYSYGEDLLFNYRYLRSVTSITCLRKAAYHYRIGNNTLSTKMREEQFQTGYFQWRVLVRFYKERNLWNSQAQSFLYRRLWGEVYDGLFLYPHLKTKTYRYLKSILSVPEIKDLSRFTASFSCSKWIKKSILKRRAWLFYLYFCICKK